MHLFALLIGESAARHQRELAITRSRARRELARAIGQVGNQLALALWRAEELASGVRRTPMCSACRLAVQPVLERFDEFPQGRLPPPSRCLPIVGTVG